MGGGDGVLFDDEDALLEEVGEGSDAVGLGDEHLLYLNRIFVRVERERYRDNTKTRVGSEGGREFVFGCNGL